MKKVLYILNDCMRKFTYERTFGLYRAIQRMDEPVNLYIVRSDGYYDFAPEHNCGEYNIFRLPDYGDYDGIFLDINSILDADSDSYTRGVLYAVRAAAEAGKPVISMANDIDGFYYVGIDNYSAMQSVIRYLHRTMRLSDFWFAMGPADNYENQTRTRALLDYCGGNGLPCEGDRLFTESFIIESGIHAFQHLLARHGGKLPQAIICANDHIALGVCHAAELAGYRVPDDVMVTGFDNIDVASYLSPSITSVDQLCWNMGDACMDAMRKIWAGESVPRRIYTPTELILRETTGHTMSDEEDLRRHVTEYISHTSSITDFNYRLSALQYQLPACKTIEEICEALVRCLSVLNCKGASLVLDDALFDCGGVIEFSDHTGRMRDVGDGMAVEGYSGRMKRIFTWRRGEELCFERRGVGSRLCPGDYSGPGENHLFVPLHFMEHTVGYLAIWDCIEMVRIKAVSAIVNTLAVALRNFFAQRNLSYINHVLSGISMKDHLTGLYNRLGYHDLAYPLYRRLCGLNERLAIIFIDMDRLKYLNDTFGHTVGDRAIQCVSNAIRHSVPQDAIPVRYGGDEFIVLVPAKGEADAEELLAAIAARLPGEAEALNMPDAPGISAGYVLTNPGDRISLDDYVRQADSLMYAEKKHKKRARND